MSVLGSETFERGRRTKVREQFGQSIIDPVESASQRRPILFEVPHRGQKFFSKDVIRRLVTSQNGKTGVSGKAGQTSQT